MTTLSKFFAEHVRSLTCQDFLHSDTCRNHLTKDLVLYALSNFKYFAPICLLPVLIKIRRFNKKKLRETLEYYLGCSLVGTCIGYSINMLICFIRNSYGQFSYYSFLFIPTFLGSNFIHLGSDRVKGLFQTSIFQCNIETFFLMRKNVFSRTIASSLTLQTCLFMICSAIILHCKQQYNTPEFWLLVPSLKIRLMDNVEQCLECYLHPQITCKQYLIKGLRKYFILGLTLDVIKMLLSHANPSPKQSKFVGKLKNFRIRSMSLLTAYIGIYRFAHCWLNRKRYCSDNWNHILSAFLAGSCYHLYPQSTLFAFALVQAILYLWKIFEMKTVDSKNKVIKVLLAIPYAKILFPFAVANLVHLHVMQPKYIGHLTAAITNGLTNKYPSLIHNEVNFLKAKYNFKSSR